jgi:hypothetical protein
MTRERVTGLVRKLFSIERTAHTPMSLEFQQAWGDDVLEARIKTVIDAAREEGIEMTREEALLQVADFDQSGTMNDDERTGQSTSISQSDVKRG